MKKIIYIQTWIVALLLVSCTNETAVEKAKDGVPIDNKVTETVLFSGKSNYTKILRTDAPIMGYSTIKQNSLASEELSAIDDVNSSIDNSNGTMKAKSSSSVSLLVNGLNLSELQTRIPDGRQLAKATTPVLYGSDVSFTLSRKTTHNIKGVQKVSASDTTITMYVPNLVTITSPKIEKSENLFPYCYYKGFELKWNADTNNQNGLVVIVEWYGTSISDKKTDKYIRNIDILTEDNGVAVLNDKLFDNIPENAVAYITLLRGNIAVLDNYVSDPYRLLAESHAILPLILIRNL